MSLVPLFLSAPQLFSRVITIFFRLICLNIVHKKSTGDLSALPFISLFLATSSWLGYGLLINDTSLILVNTVGATLNFAYTVLFCYYSAKKAIVLRQFVGSICAILTVLAYIANETSKDVSIKHIGFLACALTIMFSAAPLTSLFHVIKAKSAESLPFPIILMTFIVTIQWFFYGVLLHDYFIQVPNLLACFLSGFQLLLFWIYSKSNGRPFKQLQNL